MEEAKDLGLETSLMIMTAREVVRKGDAPTSALRVPPEELRNIIRQIFRFPEPRSESPLSDVTAAEPPLDHRSPPLIPATVPEHENETVPFSASASLNSSFQPPTEAPASTPIISTPVPTQNKQGTTKQTTTPNKQETKPAIVSPPKEDPKPKEDPTKSTPPRKQEDGSKGVQEQLQQVADEKAKAEAQENKRKPLSSRLADTGKAAGSPTPAKDAATPKDKDGEKPTDIKEAKDAKDTTSKKDPLGLFTTGQDPSGTPNGTPLLNQDSDQPGTPTTGQSVMICCSVQHQC